MHGDGCADWPVVAGADWLVCEIMVDAGVQVFVDRMIWCTRGLGVDEYVEELKTPS